jgi:sugar phosphate isomerase/epimerase
MNERSVARRRRFLLQSAGTAVTAGLLASGVEEFTSAAVPTAATKSIRLGAPLFDAPREPEELALAHRKLGYRAAYCPPVRLDDAQRIREIHDAFAKHDVLLAEVGRWVNLLEADADKRAANLQTVTDGLALADAIGALCCVDIAGSYNPKVWYGPHPDNLAPKFFDAAVENARKIIDAVKPRRARFTYEVMGWALPDCPDAYLRMIKAVDRPAFGVHLDPCNLINSPAKFYRNTDVLNECFDKLGPWIVSCHAKDIAWSNPVEMQVHLLEVIPGQGALDYATYLKRLAGLPGNVPLMLEHLKTAEEYGRAKQHIMEVGGKAGVRFE